MLKHVANGAISCMLSLSCPAAASIYVWPGGGWTAVKVEGCLYAAQLASKGTKPTKPKAAGKQSSAVAGGTKKRGSKAAAAAASAEDAAAGAGTEKEGGMAKAAGRGSKRAKGS